ncbi:MAG: TolC family protein, partial [Bacteroides sp.]|nr:TolC family protein [Bacteroides sp.]
MKKLMIYLSIAACMRSWGIYKPYQRPEVQTDGLFGEEYETTDTLSAGDICWQEFFTDPCLQQLIGQGLRQNTDLQIAHLRIRQAEAALLTSSLAYLPSLHLTPEGSLASFDRSAPSRTYT